MKKTYPGLDAEYISFGNNNIGTTAIPDASSCVLSNITNFTSDQDFRPVPFGQCWVPNSDYYGLTWSGRSGSFVP